MGTLSVHRVHTVALLWDSLLAGAWRAVLPPVAGGLATARVVRGCSIAGAWRGGRRGGGHDEYCVWLPLLLARLPLAAVSNDVVRRWVKGGKRGGGAARRVDGGGHLDRRVDAAAVDRVVLGGGVGGGGHELYPRVEPTSARSGGANAYL